jgi:hypothetical protein
MELDEHGISLDCDDVRVDLASAANEEFEQVE